MEAACIDIYMSLTCPGAFLVLSSSYYHMSQVWQACCDCLCQPCPSVGVCQMMIPVWGDIMDNGKPNRVCRPHRISESSKVNVIFKRHNYMTEELASHCFDSRVFCDSCFTPQDKALFTSVFWYCVVVFAGVPLGGSSRGGPAWPQWAAAAQSVLWRGAGCWRPADPCSPSPPCPFQPVLPRHVHPGYEGGAPGGGTRE